MATIRDSSPATPNRRSRFARRAAVIGLVTDTAACFALLDLAVVALRATVRGTEVVFVFSLAFVAACLFALPVSVLVARQTWGRQRAFGVAACLLALVLYAADARLFVRLYPRVHALTGFAAVTSMVLAVRMLRSVVYRARPRLLAIIVAVVVGAIGFDVSYATREYARSRSVVLGDVVAMAVPRARPMPFLPFTTLSRLAGPPGELRPELRPRLVLIVTVDALRYDVAEADKDDLFAQTRREGVWFTHARTVASSTTPSTYAMFSSRGPWSVAWRPSEYDDLAFRPLPPGATDGWPLPLEETVTTLPQALIAAGWEAKLCASVPYQTPSANVTRGFEVLLDRDWRPPSEHLHIGKDAPALSQCGERAIDAMGAKPLLLWLHYTEAHSPYLTHYETPPRSNSDRDVYESNVRYIQKYAAELVAHADAVVGRDRILLVLSADHGEEFGEHGGKYHGHSLNEEILRIPFVVRHPTLAPRVVDDPISLLDLAPTVLESAGLANLPTAEGRSLFPLMRGASLPPRAMLAQLVNFDRPRRAIVSGRFKLIFGPRAHVYALYDLVDDPGEQRVVTDEHLDITRDLAEQIGVPPP